MEITARKVIIFILILFVIFYSSTLSSRITQEISSGVNYFQEKQCESGTYNIRNCDETACLEDQKAKWENYVRYLNEKECRGEKEFSVGADNIGPEFDKRCTCIQQKVWDLINYRDPGDIWSDPFAGFSNPERAMYSDVTRVDVSIANTGSWFFNMGSWNIPFQFVQGYWDISPKAEQDLRDKGLDKYINQNLKNLDVFAGFRSLANLMESAKNYGVDRVSITLHFNNAEYNRITLKYDFKDSLEKIEYSYDNRYIIIQNVQNNRVSISTSLGGVDTISYELVDINCNSIKFRPTSGSGGELSVPNYDILCKTFPTIGAINIELGDIGEFAKKYGIEPEKLLAFLSVESANRGFESDGHPRVRFECHIFNNPDYSGCREFSLFGGAMPCTINQGESFSRVSSETNYNAFKIAFERNPERAICSTSFGLAQIIGFNYKRVGYASINDFYQAMFSEDKQKEAFLMFLVTDSVILSELRKDNTDWEVVARRYNGPAYKENQYDAKLIAAYNEYKSASQIT